MRALKILGATGMLFALAVGASAAPVLNGDLIVYYSFDDPDDLGADESGNGYDGDVIGDISRVAGLYNGAASINNPTPGGTATAYLNLPVADIVTRDGNSPTTKFTLATWTNFDAVGNYEIFGTLNSTSSAPALHAEVRTTNNYRFCIRDTSVTTIGDFRTAEGTFETGWHHIAMTYDASLSADQMAIYIDGDLSSSYSVTSANMAAWDSVARIGGTADNLSRAYVGLIDEFYLFGRTLTPTEIQTLATVPEPSSIVLTIIGALSAIFVWWWKR